MRTKLWKERRENVVDDPDEDQKENEPKEKEDERLKDMKDRVTEVKMKRQAWKMEKDLTIFGAVPCGLSFS